MPEWKGVSGCRFCLGLWLGGGVEDWMAVAIRATSCIDGLNHGVAREKRKVLQRLEYVYGTFLPKRLYPVYLIFTCL